MSETGNKIAAAAIDMVGTPFRHQGRKPRSGLDCAGVVLCSVWSAGCDVPECLGYGPIPKTDVLLTELAARLHRVHRDDCEPGDIILFEYRPNLPMHFAVLVGQEQIVHAHSVTGCVVQHRMTQAWTSRIHSIWRVKEQHG